MTDIIGSFLEKLDDLFGGLTTQLTLAESERNTQIEGLRNALTRPVITRGRVADRFSTGYLEVVPTAKPYQIAGRQLDRGSIAIFNLSASSVPVWVGSSAEAVRPLGSPGFPLAAGLTLTIDTTSEVWVFAGGAAAIAWVSSEFTGEAAR